MNNLEFILNVFDNLSSIHSEIFEKTSFEKTSLLDNIQHILRNLYIVFHCNENFKFELDTTNNCNVLKPENIENKKVMNYIYAHTNKDKKNEKLFLLSSIGFTKEKIVELKTFLEPFKTAKELEELLTKECSDKLQNTFNEYINAAKIKFNGGSKKKNTLNKKTKKQSNTFTKKNTK
jgi:hypothetical protein